jgi:diguanylate cyclase (GGDEF)-like protein
MTARTPLLPALQAWWKEERRSPLPRTTLLRRSALCLLVLAPLMALQVQRRGQTISQEQQGQRDDTLAIMEAGLAVAGRASFDWGHWDKTYAFAQGRNPRFVSHDLWKGAVFEDGTVLILLRPDRSVALVHTAPTFQRPEFPDLIRCAQDNVGRITDTDTPLRLACREGDALYLGAATLVSNSDSTAPANSGTLVMLSPLLKQEYSQRIRNRLSTLQRDLVFLPDEGSASSPQLELIEPRIHSSGGRLLGLPRPDLLPLVTRSLLGDLPLLLAIPGLVLALRMVTQLERRRQRVRRLEVERRATQTIRSTCHALDQVFETALPDRGRADSRRILGRLSGASRSTDATGHRPSQRLEHLSERFQHVLQTASELALFDALTQLPNRRYFIEQLTETTRHHGAQQQWFAVLFIDIDKFKVINDTFGHAVGDGVLVSVCQRLRRVLRAGDFLARYGGDELAVIMAFADSSTADPEDLGTQARERAQAMVDSLSEPVRIGEQAINVSLSIGISLVDPAEQDVGLMMQRSDQAMYQAKRSRDSRIVGLDVLERTPQLGNYQLFNDLMAAIRHQQLQVVFQPIRDRTGELHGAEALARWHHPQQGWIAPTLFLDLAEQHRQMPKLGHELLCLSLDGFQQLQQRYPTLRLYLNLTPSQLLCAGLAASLLEQLQCRGLHPRQLTLELTEHSILEPDTTVKQNLTQLRQAGARLALDDFGTGYSSLMLLKTLQPEVVKIDKSFTQAIHSDSGAVHIISLVAELGTRMGVQLVGEGIEDPATLNQLRDLGVPLFQGNALGRPTSLDAWLTGDQRRPTT